MTETTNEDLFAKTFDIYFEKYGKLLEQIYPTFSSDNGFEEPNQTVGFLSAYKEARITPPFKAETPLLTWLEMPFHGRKFFDLWISLIRSVLCRDGENGQC